ncbi:hypothetical protein ACFRMQ_19385 [Kitasatospora sp. NPDC056783]|uniref:hypothetical protein n=1 Tax=Kitasatospora sp. NPDC056783 TaxID=3345943 RepID=UPI003692ED73
MKRASVMSGALAVVVALAPAALVVVLGVFDPHGSRRWVWLFAALAVAGLGIAYGGDWESWWRRRRAQAHVRAGQRRGSVLCREARRERVGR